MSFKMSSGVNDDIIIRLVEYDTHIVDLMMLRNPAAFSKGTKVILANTSPVFKDMYEIINRKMHIIPCQERWLINESEPAAPLVEPLPMTPAVISSATMTLTRD